MKSIFENKVFKNYEKLGFTIISAKLELNEETGKKKLTPPFEWQKMTKTTINTKKDNAVMIRNKIKFSDGSYLYGIDLDNKLDVEGKTGIEWFRNYCFSIKCFSGQKLLVQETGNKGIHYFFRTFNTALIEEGPITGLKINGITRQIDIPNAFISEPSEYGGKKYKFLNIDEFDDFNEIPLLPQQIEELILTRKSKLIESTEETEEETEEEERPVENVNPNYPLLNILSSHFENYSEWSRICWIMKSLNYPFSVFDEYSRKYPHKYNPKDVYNFWNRCKTNNKMTEGILHSLAKQANPAEYNKLKITTNYKPDILPVEVIEMTEEQINNNNGYLIHKDNINLDFKDCLISNKLNEFFTSNIKSFNIKSPYDTGKTQLLTKIMKKYKQKRVLFLSYRKTLTSDLMSSFSELGFQDYRNAICNETDKLIIQLESINKIKPSFMFVDDEFEIPKYDLIIIDEVESILQQFNSETFQGESKNAFEFIDAIISNSNKLITLDGDLSFRGFNYINHFGDSINIVNPVKKNRKTFYLIDSENTFHSNIESSLNDNKKIVIVSQSSKKCDNLFVFIKQKYPKLNIGIYTGATNDKDKNDLSNVLENWIKLDVLIYSPTIESGVNFDIVHFDKIFGIVSSGCNSQRAFCQMLSRVRKVKDKNITLWCSQLKYTEINKSNIYTFDEVKESLLTLDIIKINETIEGSKMVKRLTPYDINFCYNKIEDLMKHKFFYLGYLVYLLTNKGHIVINLIEEKEKKEKVREDINKCKIDDTNLLNSIDDITEGKFKYLLEKQKQSNADKIDKLQIKKYLIKSSLGVDKLDENILEYYDSPLIIKKIEHLIDKTNIKNYNDNQTKENIKKVDIINDLINKLGFKLFDNKTISRDKFEKNIDEIIKTNELFINPKLANILFNSSKVNIKTNKQFLGFVNTVLENYKLKIQSKEIRVKKEDIEKVGKTKDTAYSLEWLKGYDTINELIQYKIDKGYKLNDTNKLRPKPTTEQYKYLVLTEEERNKYYDDLQNKELNRIENKYIEVGKNKVKVNTSFDFPDPFGLDYGLKFD